MFQIWCRCRSYKPQQQQQQPQPQHCCTTSCLLLTAACCHCEPSHLGCREDPGDAPVHQLHRSEAVLHLGLLSTSASIAYVQESLSCIEKWPQYKLEKKQYHSSQKQKISKSKGVHGKMESETPLHSVVALITSTQHLPKHY